MTTEAEIETEAKRWAAELLGYKHGFYRWSEHCNIAIRTLAYAHTRHVLERRGKPGDVDAYGPLPPREITDAAVLRCAEAMWTRVCAQPWDDTHWAARDFWKQHARVCLTVFLSPPDPDPIQTAVNRAASEARAAGIVWTVALERIVRAVAEGRKDG